MHERARKIWPTRDGGTSRFWDGLLEPRTRCALARRGGPEARCPPARGNPNERLREEAGPGREFFNAWRTR